MTIRLPYQRPRAGGFSLLELVVVLVLIGIMTAMIIPEMRGTFDDELLRSTSRKLLSALNLAFSQAVTVSEEHRVRLDAQEGRYVVERANSDPEGEMGFVPVRSLPGGAGPLDERITIEVRKPVAESDDEPPQQALPSAAEERDDGVRMDSITFHPDGTADGREIVLRDRAGFGLALRVNPITARVQIVELDRK